VNVHRQGLQPPIEGAARSPIYVGAYHPFDRRVTVMNGCGCVVIVDVPIWDGTLEGTGLS
jgi:hypothetical protein